MNRLRHYRRQKVRQGRPVVVCDCGFEHELDPFKGNQPMVRHEIEAALEAKFAAHLPEDERRLYILVDQRQGHVGNWIMPEGLPCMLLSHFDADGVRHARFMRVELEEVGDEGEWKMTPTGDIGMLPVGEIRTADNRVFKADLAA